MDTKLVRECVAKISWIKQTWWLVDEVCDGQVWSVDDQSSGFLDTHRLMLSRSYHTQYRYSKQISSVHPVLRFVSAPAHCNSYGRMMVGLSSLIASPKVLCVMHQICTTLETIHIQSAVGRNIAPYLCARNPKMSMQQS